MPEVTGGAAPSAQDLPDVLLQSKVSIPALRHLGVNRRALIRHARASGARAVAVTAPAGYGKSTMLAEWAATDDRRVAWAAVDRLDNDPTALLALLAHACSPVSASVAGVAAEMRGVGAGTLGRSAPLLAAALAATDEPFVLFIDDLHEAGSVDCLDVLEIVLSGVPAGSQVVIASRQEQTYLARLRVLGETFDVGESDLRVDVLGARTIFDDAGVDAAAYDLDALVERCEGWAAGLFLCALVARAGGDPAELTGEERFLADYLYRECVGRLSEDVQRFLRCTAILERFNAPVCDAVIGESGSHQPRLEELESLGLFLLPLDRQRRWFRYHGLFRDFLLAELRRQEPELERELHLRAATWFEQAGLEEVAVEHLLAAGDVARAAPLIAELSLPAYQSGRVATVSRWMADVGAQAVEEYAPLLVVAAWKSILLGETAEAERWTAALEPAGSDPVPDEDRIPLDSARAMIRSALCREGAERAVADAAFGVANEPSWSPWRDQALHLYGATSLLVGKTDSAQQAFTDAIATATAAGNPDTVILSEAELAHLAIDIGDWASAGRHSQAAIEVVEASHMEGYSTTALAFAVRARVAVKHGDAEAARRFLTRGMRARVQCTYLLPWLSVRVRLQLAMAHAALDDRPAAMHLLTEADQIMRKRPGLGRLTAEVAAFRRKVDRAPALPGAPPLTPAELRLVPYLQTHLTIGEIGQRLFVSRNTVSSEVGSIYRKLGVSTRSAAVDRAIASGLLGA